jgi:hypothetical protein
MQHLAGVVLYVLVLIAGGVATVRQARRKPARIAAERALARAPIPPPRPAVRRAVPPVPAASFADVDLTLPDADSAFAPTPKRRRVRVAGGVPALGSRAWAANAVIAMEVLSAPVALRGSATPDGPRAL